MPQLTENQAKEVVIIVFCHCPGNLCNTAQKCSLDENQRNFSVMAQKEIICS